MLEANWMATLEAKQTKNGQEFVFCGIIGN